MTLISNPNAKKMSTPNPIEFRVRKVNPKGAGALVLAIPKGFKLTEASKEAICELQVKDPGTKEIVSAECKWTRATFQSDRSLYIIGKARLFDFAEMHAAIEELVDMVPTEGRQPAAKTNKPAASSQKVIRKNQPAAEAVGTYVVLPDGRRARVIVDDEPVVVRQKQVVTAAYDDDIVIG